MDPFTAAKLDQIADDLTPPECKEYTQGEMAGPSLAFQETSKRSIFYACEEVDRSDSTCMECPFYPGKEIFI